MESMSLFSRLSRAREALTFCCLLQVRKLPMNTVKAQLLSEERYAGAVATELGSGQWRSEVCGGLFTTPSHKPLVTEYLHYSYVTNLVFSILKIHYGGTRDCSGSLCKYNLKPPLFRIKVSSVTILGKRL